MWPIQASAFSPASAHSKTNLEQPIFLGRSQLQRLGYGFICSYRQPSLHLLDQIYARSAGAKYLSAAQGFDDIR
jgi:hypothetical protein